jgi:hypothetical protein
MSVSISDQSVEESYQIPLAEDFGLLDVTTGTMTEDSVEEAANGEK